MKLALRIPLAATVAIAMISAGTPWAGAQTASSRLKSSRYALDAGKPGAAPTVLTAEPEVVTTPAQTVDQQTPAPAAAVVEGHDFLDAWEDGEAVCDEECNGGPFARPGLWYGTVDYLLARSRFSQGVAEVRQTTTFDGTTTPAVSTQSSDSIQFPFRYQSSFRAGLGYRLLDCGGDIQFVYWRLTGSAQLSDGPASVESGSRVIFGQLGNNPGDGQFWNGTAGVTANVYDFDFAKCLAFGGPKTACDACFCPRWDLRWSAGVRAADISRFDNSSVTTSNGDLVSRGNINARFTGAGARVGLQGRRYFGQRGLVSLYGKASQGLLIGNYKSARTLITPGFDTETNTSVLTQHDTFARLVPVTDIEVGGSIQLAPYAFISAGWFFQCWWDLGQGETVPGGSFGPLDTANILGFDGLFVRGELLF
jgi:hypothetical protein